MFEQYHDQIHKGNYTTKFLCHCFGEDIHEIFFDIREYLNWDEYIVYNGIQIPDNGVKQVESNKLPIEFITKFISTHEERDDAKAWIRIWSNYCDDYIDFVTGMPGECNEFDCEHKQATWEEISKGEAFANLEARIFAYKLLKGEM
jgi:hypothetical protein